MKNGRLFVACATGACIKCSIVRLHISDSYCTIFFKASNNSADVVYFQCVLNISVILFTGIAEYARELELLKNTPIPVLS